MTVRANRGVNERADQIAFIVAVFVGEVRFWGRGPVRVGYCVSQVVVEMESSRGFVRARGGVNEDMDIE